MDDTVARWKQWADRLGVAPLSTRDEFKQTALTMSEESFAELGEFYERALREDDLRLINAWLQTDGGRVPMGQDEQAIRHLVVLFQYLAGSWGRRPFSSQSIKSEHLVEATPDWSKLPEDLACLAEAPEICRRFTSVYIYADEGRAQIREMVSKPELAQLSRAAEEVRRIGHQRIINWRKRVGTDIHVEAKLVSILIPVLDSLELPYY